MTENIWFSIFIRSLQDPNKQPPEPMSVVVTFIYLVEFSSILSHPGLTEQCAEVLSTFVDVCVRCVVSPLHLLVCYAMFLLRANQGPHWFLANPSFLRSARAE